MTDESQPVTESPTLQELIERHRDRDLPTHVFVTGTGRHFPDDLRPVARRVSEMIRGDDGHVYECDFGRLHEVDVALLEVDHNFRLQSDDVDELRDLATVSRASSYAGIVGYTNATELPKSLLQVLEAVVEVGEDGVEFIGRVCSDYHDGGYYKVELDGLESDSSQNGGESDV